MHVIKVKLTTLLLLICIGAIAQRPKVGLVLSGGGAKGISHIGILEAIDSAGLKIDYLTGTSMGTVVGSLYSVGYSGKQIEKELNKLDWNILLSNRQNFQDISIDEKGEYGQYCTEIGLDNFKPKIASGLIESEELWLKLNEMFLPVYDIKDFSKFNIPFKCISTDLSNGEAVVLTGGEIVPAVRSSMAIPSVFTAIEIDSKKLVDGGIVRNFPVTDVKEMGADIVIGVNLFTGLPEISKINSALDILYQIIQYRDANDLLIEKKLCDLVIEPPVQEYSAGSFSASDDIMKIGKEVGNLYYPYFKRLADSLNAIYPVNYDPYNRLPKTDKVTVDSIEFLGIKNTSKSLLQDKIGIDTGKCYHAEEISNGFRRAYASRYYDHVRYEMEPTSPGHIKLKCIAKEASLTQAKLGFSYHTYTGVALIANITTRNFIVDKSRTLVKLAIGDHYRFLFNQKQGFGRKANDFFNLSFLTENLPLNIYNDKGEKEYLYRTNYLNADFNYTHVFIPSWSASVGASYNDLHYSPKVAANLRLKGYSIYYHAYLKTELNTCNAKRFPTKGQELSIEGGVVFSRRAKINATLDDGTSADISSIIDNSREFYKFRLNYIKYIPLYKKNVVYFYNIQAAINYHSQNFLFDNFQLGGVQQIFGKQVTFVGLNEGQITTASCVVGMMGVQTTIFKDLFLNTKVNAAIFNFSSEKELFVPNQEDIITGISAGIGYNLRFLPMEFNVMYSPEIGKVYNNIKIGFIF